FHSQPPLYYIALHSLIKINSSEWFLRGFSWVAILALFYFVLFYLEELNLVARVFFCIFFVFHGFTHLLAQELRPYALSALTSFIPPILFLRRLPAPTPPQARAYAIAALLMLYTLAFDVWVFICHGLYFIGLLLAELGWRGARPALRRYLPVAVS